MKKVIYLVAAGLIVSATGCSGSRAAKNSRTETTQSTPPAAVAAVKAPAPVVEAAPKAEVVEQQAPVAAPAEPVAAVEQQEPLQFPVVGFEFDSDLLTAEGRRALDEFAARWRKQGGSRALIVEGHADERGTEEYNVLLGQKRAAAVRAYLARLGAAEDALRTVSYGEDRPLDDSATEDAWARNRRAEVRPVQ